jgi:PAS domain S-box-containing protein
VKNQALQESERRYRLLAENVSDVIWTYDLRTMRLSWVSPSVLGLRGLTVEEAMAEPLEASMTAESLARVREALAGAIAGSQPDRNVGVIDQPHKDGSLRHVEITTTVVRDAGGTPVEVVGVSRDATERVGSERRLAGSENLLRAVADSSPDAIFAKDLSGRWTFANVAAIHMLGMPVDQVIGRTEAEIQFDPGVARQLMANDRRVIEEGAPITFAETVLTPEGSRKFLTSKAPLRDPEGRIVGVVGTARDVSALETATEELRRSRQRLALAMEGSTDGFWDIDVVPARVFLSSRYRQLIGWPAMEGEVGIEEMMALIEPDFLPGIQANISDLRSGAIDRFSWEYQTRGADGSLRWLQSRGKVVERGLDGAPTRISGTISDIHERKVAEEALRASEGRLRLIARSFPQGSIALFDEEDHALLVDGKTIFLGLEPQAYLGKKPHDFAPPEFAGQLVDALRRARSGETVRAENRIRGRIVESHVSPAIVDGKPSGMCILVSQDVTARREVEENLAVASRLAAMGTLISGIAHEINNPLSGAMAGTDWAARRIREMQLGLDGAVDPRCGDMARELGEILDSLEDAMAGSRRIAAIVRDLITTGHPSPDRTRVRIRDVVAEAVLRMPAPLRERFMVRVVDQGAPDVLAAAGQLSQAIANLLDNAAEALPADGGQDIVVRIGRTATDGACVEVEDPGSGIPADVLGRVFDPFFTTRPIGQGIGLGLSVAHAIVTAHGGTISASSTPGKGSTFRIELPAAS